MKKLLRIIPFVLLVTLLLVALVKTPLASQSNPGWYPNGDITYVCGDSVPGDDLPSWGEHNANSLCQGCWDAACRAQEVRIYTCTDPSQITYENGGAKCYYGSYISITNQSEVRFLDWFKDPCKFIQIDAYNNGNRTDFVMFKSWNFGSASCTGSTPAPIQNQTQNLCVINASVTCVNNNTQAQITWYGSSNFPVGINQGQTLIRLNKEPAIAWTPADPNSGDIYTQSSQINGTVTLPVVPGVKYDYRVALNQVNDYTPYGACTTEHREFSCGNVLGVTSGGQCTRSGARPNMYNYTTGQTFPDVSPSNTVYYSAIQNLECKNVIHGYKSGYFAPYEPITRGALAKIVSGALRLPETTFCGDFYDVPRTNSFYTYIQTLKCLGISDGYSNNTFRPNEYITREGAMKFIIRAARWTRPELFNNTSNWQVYTDVPTYNVFYDYINTAYSHNITDPNYSTYFRPSSYMTRQESALMLDSTMRYLESNGWGSN